MRRTLASYFAYDQELHARLSLAHPASVPCQVEHPREGKMIAIPRVGSSHHRNRRAARVLRAVRVHRPREADIRATGSSQAIVEPNRLTFVALSPLVGPQTSASSPRPSAPGRGFQKPQLLRRFTKGREHFFGTAGATIFTYNLLTLGQGRSAS